MAHAPVSPTAADPAAAFRPYVPADQEPAELTFRAVALGSILGVVFGASSLYLFLKVGMTVSASIPVAVLAITIFRGLSYAFGLRRATILENNVVQTAGSAGESIAFGVGATMPALMLLGYNLEWSRVMLVSVLGGLLGILMMIPLRKAFIVKQHGVLPYPEGTACAKVLIVGEHGGSNARTVFLGFGLGAMYKILMQGLKLWPAEWDKAVVGIKGYNKAVVALEPDPTLLGVGYIIGPRIAAVMVGGGLLTSLMLVPMIAYFGEGLPTVLPPGQAKIAEMAPGQISGQYVRYIGAGAVATGGILSMLNALPLIFSSIAGSLKALRPAGATGEIEAGDTPRTDRDIPLPLVLLGTLGLVALIATSSLIPADATGRIAGACLVVLFGFLFVTVSSRITGVIGSSSNPISGMTIATLLLTCLIFVALGWVGGEYRLIALSIAAVVCIASSNGGTISQDLKTGYLVGATPWRQQVAILVGALLSAVVMGGTLLWLNDAYTTYSNRPEDLPTASFDVSKVSETDSYEGREFKVVRLTAPIEGALPGTYFVNDAGKAEWIKDAGIGGRLDHTTSGAPIRKFNPPQPRLFATIIDGIMSGDLPWGLVILGAVLAIVVQLAGVSALAFAVGVYLPLSTTLPIFIGGLVRLLVDRARKFSAEDSETSPGTMMSTGLIAGGSLAGILIALLVVFENLGKAVDFSSVKPGGEAEYLLPALGAFGVLTVSLLVVAMTGKRQDMGQGVKDETSLIDEP
ncbi:OPT family oligopeptide transporter [Paludisphaera mucosa]|uniref:Oligopeptide transporter, OPT family n=1 Tax=Paludisphaera mucosa TaxID=3030827 RepID=A0ABT6F6K5_9BACT|nr:oligopeptide transporter, OPT family [Paludisphaera mucosa]MDG3003225.1 oligopeptide transporter, OPT family [Paludisphaera mucosa]